MSICHLNVSARTHTSSHTPSTHTVIRITKCHMGKWCGNCGNTSRRCEARWMTVNVALRVTSTTLTHSDHPLLYFLQSCGMDASLFENINILRGEYYISVLEFHDQLLAFRHMPKCNSPILMPGTTVKYSLICCFGIWKKDYYHTFHQ